MQQCHSAACASQLLSKDVIDVIDVCCCCWLCVLCLGHGDFTDHVLPKRVEAGDLHLTRVRKIAVGQHHTVVLNGTYHSLAPHMRLSEDCDFKRLICCAVLCR